MAMTLAAAQALIDAANASNAAVANALLTALAPAPAPTPVPPPVATTWVYHNGALAWNDNSYGATANFADTVGAPVSGTKDIAVTTQAYGGLEVSVPTPLDATLYDRLTVSLKPTVANQAWQLWFRKVGDVAVGINVDLSKYGPAPVVGKWATYVIPLADVGALGIPLYKFSIQDFSGLAKGLWYADEIGFLPKAAVTPAPVPVGAATYVGGKQPGVVVGTRGVNIPVVVNLGGPLNTVSVDVQLLSAGVPATGAGNFASKVPLTASTYGYTPVTSDGGGKLLSCVLTPRDANGVAGVPVTIPGVPIP